MARTPSPILTRWRSLSRLAKAAIILVVVLVLYTLFGFFGLPPIARHYLAKGLSESLKRPTTVEAVHFNPWTFRTEIEKLDVTEPDGSQPFAGFSRLVVDVRYVSLLKLALVVGEVRITSPHVHLVLEPGGKTNISDLVAAFASAPAEPAPKPEEKDKKNPFPFIVNNFVIETGSIEVDDQVRKVVHHVTDLNLQVPFTSSLPKDVETFVKPQLSMVVNGSPLTLVGRTLPFADSLRTEFDLKLDGVKLPEYWPYSPLAKHLALAKGTLDTNLTWTFERTGKSLPETYFHGSFSVNDLELRAADQPVAAFKTLGVNVERFSLREMALHLASVALTEPFARVARAADGGLNWSTYLELSADKSTASPAEPAKETDAGPAFTVLLDAFNLSGGRLAYADATVPGGFTKDVTPIEFTVSSLSTAKDAQPAALKLAVGPAGGERITLDGSFSPTPLSAEARLSLADLRIPAYAPYFAANLPWKLTGATLGVGAKLRFAATPLAFTADDLTVSLRDLALALPEAKTPWLSLPVVDVSGGRFDLAGRRAEVATVALKGGTVRLERAADGAIDILAPLAAPAAGTAPAKPEAAAHSTGQIASPKPGEPAKPEEPTFAVAVRDIDLSGLTVDLTDKTTPAPVHLAVTDLGVHLAGLAMPLDKPLHFRLSAGLPVKSRLAVNGQLALPLDLTADVELSDLDLPTFLPYLPPDVPVRLAGGSFATKGRLRVKGGETPAIGYAGELALSRLRATDAAGKTEVASLASLALAKIDLATAPFKLTVGSASLSDLRLPAGKSELAGLKGLEARGFSLTPENGGLALTSLALRDLSAEITLAKDGKLNLTQTLATLNPPPAAAKGGAADKAPPPAPATAQKPAGTPDSGIKTISLGEASLSGGTIRFTDQTVDPAYSTTLTKLKAKLTGLTLGSQKPAPFDFSALLNQTTPLTVSGTLATSEPAAVKFNLSLDGLDLARLSPYSVRYIAYPIDTGSLKTDTDLAIAGSAMSGSSAITIRDLNLGQKVASKDAPNVPIELGLTLLEDPTGAIRLSLPLSGNLSDPKFSVGGIIFGAITNMLVKIVAAPFTILASLFGGGGDELNVLNFPPGVSSLESLDTGKLTTLAKAMADRPKLELGLTGRADPGSDRPAMEEARFQYAIKSEKYKALLKAGTPPQSVDDVIVMPDEYPEYLTKAWDDAPIDKEKNFLGFVKDQPVEVMERMLRKHFEVTDDDLTALAKARAEAVAGWLTTTGGVDPARVAVKPAQPTGGRVVELGVR